MKVAVLVAAAFAAAVNGAVIEARQRGRPTTRPGNPGGPDGTDSPIEVRAAQDSPPWISLGLPRPSQSVTFFPNDPGLSDCGLDAFAGHTSEASLFCSSILKGGTATLTSTYTTRETTTVKTTTYVTLFPPSTPPAPSSTPKPPVTTPKPPTSTPKPPTTTTAAPPSGSSSCGLVGYTKSTAAYFFDSSGTKNTWAACSAACKADAKCKSFGYGEANCMLFDVPAVDNVSINPMSPYTFYDSACPKELPVKRQVNITVGLPGGAPAITSACSCLIGSAPADATRTTTVTVTSVRVTRTETVTKTVSVLPFKE